MHPDPRTQTEYKRHTRRATGIAQLFPNCLFGARQTIRLSWFQKNVTNSGAYPLAFHCNWHKRPRSANLSHSLLEPFDISLRLAAYDSSPFNASGVRLKGGPTNSGEILDRVIIRKSLTNVKLIKINCGKYVEK